MKRCSIAILVILLATTGCEKKNREFVGLYIQDEWLDNVENSDTSLELLGIFGGRPAWIPVDWYKIEVFPDEILVDDGRIEIDDFEIRHGKLRFNTNELRGFMETAVDEADRFNVTLTSLHSGKQERYVFRAIEPSYLAEVIKVAEARAQK